jgi:hypothetical protein
MNEQEMNDLEEKIVAQCEKRKAEGWWVLRFQSRVAVGNGEPCRVCALGTFADPSEVIGEARYSDIAVRALAMTEAQAGAFADGFDGFRYLMGPKTFHALGARVAARVLP